MYHQIKKIIHGVSYTDYMKEQSVHHPNNGSKCIITMKGGRRPDELMHYGVKGQKWGVVTKEYEPVAVNHRRTGNGGLSSKVRGYLSKRRQELNNEKAKVVKERETKRIRKETATKIAAYASLALMAYGGYKYSKIVKAKAYTGTLARFLKQNPSVNFNTEEGRVAVKRALGFAKENSKLRNAFSTNRYMKGQGIKVNRKQAMKMYKSRHLMNRMANVKTGNNRFEKAVNNYRKKRLAHKIAARFYM